MLDSFEIGGPLGCVFAGSQPIDNRLLGQPAFDEVIGQDLRLRPDTPRNLLLKCYTDPRVQDLALAAQQSAVGSVPYQRVLEKECGLRRDSAPKDQTRVEEAAERITQLGISSLGGSRQ